MREEYDSVLSTPTEADKIGRFGRYRYIGETQISARPIYRSICIKVRCFHFRCSFDVTVIERKSFTNFRYYCCFRSFYLLNATFVTAVSLSFSAWILFDLIHPLVSGSKCEQW